MDFLGRLWRRNVLSPAPVAEVGNARLLFSAPKHRAAVVYFQVPAGVLVAGGIVYTPPNTGAVVKWFSCHQDSGAAVDYRFGILTQEALALASFGVLGTASQFPIWPDSNPIGGSGGVGLRDEGGRLLGTLTPVQGLGFGDLAQALTNTPYFNVDIQVMPGNVFLVLLGTANLISEGALEIHEFIDPSLFNV